MPELDRAAIAVAVGILILFGLPIGGPARVLGATVLALEFVAATLIAPRWWPVGRIDRSAAIWLAALGGWLLLTGLFGADPATSIGWLVGHAAFGWFGVLAVALLGRRRIPGVLVVALAVPTLIALASIAGPVLAGGRFDMADRLVITGDLAALSATLVALVVLFDGALHRVPVWLRAAVVLVATIIIVAADSRSMAVAAVVAAAYGLWRSGRRTVIAKSTLVVVVGGVLVVLLFGIDAGSLVDRAATDLANGGGRDASWEAAIAAVQDRPLLGYGLGNHGDVLAQYRLTSHFAVEESTQSLLLLAALAGGLPAVGLMAGTFVAMARNATESQRTMLVAILVFGLGDSPFEVLGVTTFIVATMLADYSSSVSSTEGSTLADAKSGSRDDLSV